MLALVAKHGDMVQLTQELRATYGPASEGVGFFEDDAVVIDVSRVEVPSGLEWLNDVAQALTDCHLRPTALHTTDAQLMRSAQSAGWLLAQEPLRTSGATPGIETAQPIAAPPPAADAPEVERVREIAVAPKTLVIDKPVRSGQKIYARGGDLVLMSMVNPGAEVIADGHIHAYAPLRGKVFAGANGNVTARIFALNFAPELVAIAGVYRTSENPLPPDIQGKPACVRLSADGQEQLIFEALLA
ncbi:MAG: septum site-determining protein MinC [Rhodoferax sp.]